VRGKPSNHIAVGVSIGGGCRCLSEITSRGNVNQRAPDCNAAATREVKGFIVAYGMVSFARRTLGDSLTVSSG